MSKLLCNLDPIEGIKRMILLAFFISISTYFPKLNCYKNMNHLYSYLQRRVSLWRKKVTKFPLGYVLDVNILKKKLTSHTNSLFQTYREGKCCFLIWEVEKVQQAMWHSPAPIVNGQYLTHIVHVLFGVCKEGTLILCSVFISNVREEFGFLVVSV